MNFLNFESEILVSSEKLASEGKFEESLRCLKSLGLDAWGELLWSLPNPKFPTLSELLPKMSSQEVQESWTGCSGEKLLNQSTAFVRYCLNVHNFRSDQSSGLTLLDYGSGFGRISRLMLKFVESQNLFGVDAWQHSINLTKEAGFGENFMLIEEVPEKLPFKESSFDLIWAFSVFTHLAPKVSYHNISTLAKYLHPKGTLVITIRPIEYWDVRTDLPKDVREQLKFDHKFKGEAFLPHEKMPDNVWGVTYGDTSFSIEFLQKNLGLLKIKDVDRSASDPYQIYLTLGY
jgi:SAM-dependent methyltransferase